MPRSEKTPSRRLPFDGLKPVDFVEDKAWPDGALQMPKLLATSDLTEEQKQAAYEDIAELRALAQDYIAYVGGSDDKKATLARKVGISENTLAASAKGSRFPAWSTYRRLNKLLPTARQRRAGIRKGARVGLSRLDD